MMRKYLDHDYLHMCDWYIARNLKCPTPVLLPETGLIINDTAAGFLIKTDARVGILDFFISNPNKDKYVRQNALDEIAHALIMTAKNFECIQVVCNTKFGNIKEMANRHGFNYLGEYSAFCKEI